MKFAGICVWYVLHLPRCVNRLCRSLSILKINVTYNIALKSMTYEK